MQLGGGRGRLVRSGDIEAESERGAGITCAKRVPLCVCIIGGGTCDGDREGKSEGDTE